MDFSRPTLRMVGFKDIQTVAMPLFSLILWTILGAMPWIGTAAADSSSCQECCKSRGLAGCPTKWRIYGEGSETSPESGGWRIVGVWSLDCENGAIFDGGATTMLVDHPKSGEFLRLASPPDTIRCFERNCALPVGSCIREDSSNTFYLVRCADGKALSSREYQTRPPTPTIRARPATETPVVTPTRVIIPNTDSDPAPVSATTPPTQVAIGGQVRSTQSSRVSQIELPDPPPQECKTSDLLRAESRRHVDRGDVARQSRKSDQAVNEYKAAISLDPCNAYAWSTLGELAYDLKQPNQAIRALRVTTRLMPRHYGALTLLGLAYEQLGRTALAESAFQDALAIAPDHQPAQVGLKRVTSSR